MGARTISALGVLGGATIITAICFRFHVPQFGSKAAALMVEPQAHTVDAPEDLRVTIGDDLPKEFDEQAIVPASALPVGVGVQKEDWLLNRKNGPPQTTEQRLEMIMGVFERYKNTTGQEEYAFAYQASAYAVATLLDRQNRAVAADAPRPGPDEWEVMTLEARYVFPKAEFPAYTRICEEYAAKVSWAQRQLRTKPASGEDPYSIAFADPLSAESKHLVDSFVDRAMQVLTKE